MAKSSKVDFVVITPERQVVADSTDSLTIPAHDGELGILPQRAPLMCELGIGQLRFHKDGKVQRYYIEGGFAQVFENQVSVLTDNACPAEEITPQRIAEAEKKLAALPPSRENAAARARVIQSVNAMRRMTGHSAGK